MSHDPDESAAVPDDRLLVRPYVAPSGRPSRPAASPWPEAGPLSFAGQVPSRAPGTASTPLPDPAPGRGGKRPARTAALCLLALAAAAGGSVYLLTDSDPRPESRSGRPPGLSVPALPAHGPDGVAPSAGAAETAGPAASAPAAPDRAPATPTAPETAGPSGEPAASRGASPAPPPPRATAPGTPPAGTPAAGAGTLRPGDRGPAVRELQERLFGQGFTYVEVTGVYDERTRRGVAQLQRDRDIDGDPQGVYGPATRAVFG